MIADYSVAQETGREHVRNALTVLCEMNANQSAFEIEAVLRAVKSRLERALVAIQAGRP